MAAPLLEEIVEWRRSALGGKRRDTESAAVQLDKIRAQFNEAEGNRL